MIESIETFPCPEISEEDAALGNVLFGMKEPVEVDLPGGTYRLCFLPGFPSAFRPALRYGISVCGRQAILELDALPFPKLLGFPDGGLDPAQVHPDLLVSLLESVLDKPRAAMERFLGGGLKVVSASEPDGSVLPEGRAWLYVDAIGAERRIRCRLLLDPADALSLAGAFRDRLRVRNHGWLDMQVPVRFRAGLASLTAGECASLAGGDIVLMNADPLASGAIRLEAGESKKIRGAAWTATWKKTKVSVEELAMEETNTMATERDGAAAMEIPGAEGGALEKIEVQLSFDLGTRLMTLAELGGIAAGTVIPLPDNPEGKITIRVSGKAIGMGYLIKVGGRTGVRIESIGGSSDGAC